MHVNLTGAGKTEDMLQRSHDRYESDMWWSCDKALRSSAWHDFWPKTQWSHAWNISLFRFRCKAVKNGLHWYAQKSDIKWLNNESRNRKWIGLFEWTMDISALWLNDGTFEWIWIAVWPKISFCSSTKNEYKKNPEDLRQGNDDFLIKCTFSHLSAPLFDYTNLDESFEYLMTSPL